MPATEASTRPIMTRTHAVIVTVARWWLMLP